MTGSIAAMFHELHRRRVRDERGLALLFVLGAIVLTSLVVVSLLGLALVTTRVTVAQRQAASEQRAADGALETAVGKVARSVKNNPCEEFPADSTIDFAAERDAQGDPLEVEMTCDPLPLPPAPTDPTNVSSEVLGGPAVELVGQRYGGGVAIPAGSTADPTLVHTGADALEFESDVTVARGAAASVTSAAGPALTATGQYVQGRGGPSETGPSPCGLLDAAAGSPTVAIVDRDLRPECNNVAAQTLASRTGSIFSGTENVSDRDVPATCPGAGTKTLEFLPGRYDAVDTARLNRLLNGSCTGRTFWFQAGKYSFDVNDAGAAAADRFALVIADASAKVVFGEANGWTKAAGATEANFPRACNAGRSGASIQLSARSTIRHRAGRVAICPAWSPTSTALPAIVQSSTAPSQPILVSTTDLPAGGVFPEVTTLCFNIIWRYDCSGGHRVRTFSTKWASTGTAPLDSAHFLVESSEYPPVHQARRVIAIDVSSPTVTCSTGDISGGRTNGQYTWIDLMSSQNPGDCKTKLQSKTEAVFEGATITVRHRYTDPTGGNQLAVPGCGTAPGCRVTLTIGDVALRTNAVTSTATAASSTGDKWRNATNARLLDGATSSVSQTTCVDDVRCTDDFPSTTREISLSGFDPTTSGLLGTDSVEHLGVSLEGLDNGQSWASIPQDDTLFRFDLKLAGDPGVAPTCTVEHQGFYRSLRASYIDLFEEGGTCEAAVKTVDDLRNAKLTLSYRSDCMWFNDYRAPVSVFTGRCFQVKLPELDRVALQVTSDSVPRAPSAEVTIAASTDPANGTSFNVFGDTLLPLLDLDVHWRGGVTDLPVFGGYLSLNALGSDQATGATMGVVCCTPPPVTTLRLQALIEEVATAQAFLYVGLPGSGGLPPQVPQARRSIGVLDWTLCGRRGCPPPATSPSPTVLGTTVTAPPTSGG